MRLSPSRNDAEKFLRRLSLAVGLLGGALVVLGVWLAIAARRAAGGGTVEQATLLFLAVFALPGAVLVAVAGPIGRGRRWACWIGQLVSAFLTAVFAAQAWRAQATGRSAGRATIAWGVLAAAAALLLLNLVVGGSRAVRREGGDSAGAALPDPGDEPIESRSRRPRPHGRPRGRRRR